MLNVLMYQRPTGERKYVDIKNVYPEDAKWFNDNNIKVSMEPDATEGNYICYADYGDPENEAIEFSLGKNCEDTLHALRETTEHLLRKYHASNQS